MKALLCSFLLFGAPFTCFTAEGDGPQLPAGIICYNGKLGSGSSCKSNASKPGTPPEKTGKMTCGFPGKVSEITWAFIGRRDGKDAYDFTRRFPLKTDNTSTQTRQVQFAGERVTIFEDKDQVIVIQSPKQ